MIELLLFVGGIAAFITLLNRQRTLEREVAQLHDRILRLDPGLSRAAAPVPVNQPRAAQPVPAPPAAKLPAAALPVAEAPSQDIPPPPDLPPSPPAAPAPTRPTFESLVGGRLPIWTGGAALVVAGFFLVRYSIESGLLGPAVRTVLAALFSAILIAASEVTRRLPATRDDPRVAQALAGAGVASAYGTLYIAAAQYHLVGALGGFAIMLGITGLALFLALRHGPPTAIMALVGGFAAPLVAGFDAAGIGPLLVYLALFVAALFGLAIRRGWTWLALAAVVAGFGWANLIVVLLAGRDASGVAAFVVALAIGATLTLPRTGESRAVLRVAPLVAGFVQLLVLVPTLDFGAVAWSFYLVLSAATLFLAWRDRSLLPGALAAPLLVLVLLGGAFVQEAPTAPAAAIAAALVFGGAGAALSHSGRRWVWIALLGIAGPVLVAHAASPELFGKPAWAGLELLAALAAAAIAWRHRDRAGTGDAGITDALPIAAALAAIALATLVALPWAPLPVAAAMLAIAYAAHRLTDTKLASRAPLFLVALVILAARPLDGLVEAAFTALVDGSPIFALLPAPQDALRAFAVPALATAVALRWPSAFGNARKAVTLVAALFGLAALYVLVKQPLAVATPIDHVARGFPDRALVTLLILGLGWLAARRPATAGLGIFLVWTALARLAWFDLLIANPVAVQQAVGPIPIANAAVALPAIAAAALLTLPPTRTWRILARIATALAIAAAVRQIAHGTYLTGDLGTGENWGYSAAFLGLAIVWLGWGFHRIDHGLRVAGLCLLTAVTLKVFLIDVAALGGILRILSFLGLGIALIAIGWAYGKLLAPKTGIPTPQPPLAYPPETV